MRNLSQRQSLVIGILFILLIMSPYFLLGENAFITIHDFLDSNPVHAKTIIDLGLLGNPEGVIPVLNGVPSQNYMPLIPIDVKDIFYIIFPTYWAIVFNIVFVRLIAFLGMYALCINYILKGNTFYTLTISVLFSLVPFYADYGLSSAGVPLFLYSAINLEKRTQLMMSYLLVIFFACNSSLSLVGIFICMLWFFWIIYKWRETNELSKYHVLGLILLSTIYFLGIISIVLNFFFPTDYVSHRVEFNNSGPLLPAVLEVFMFYVISQIHAGYFFAGLVLFISFFIFIKWGKDEKCKRNYYILFFLIILMILIGRLLKFLPVGIFSSFQFDRFYFLYPTLCFIILAKSFSFIPQKKKLVLLLVCIIGMSNLAFDKEFRYNCGKLTGLWSSNKPSYKQFFDTALFKKIITNIHADDTYQCKVVSVGMHPTVAEYNGFYTLDSYVFSYSLDYKHQFRKVISGELKKNEDIKRYFDDWGSRCYIFSSELKEKGNQYLCSKNDQLEVKHLDINQKYLKELGCQYILSAVDIKNYRTLGLSLIGIYTNPDSFWNIKVYSLDKVEYKP